MLDNDMRQNRWVMTGSINRRVITAKIFDNFYK